MTRNYCMSIIIVLLTSLVTSCSEVDITMPKGPKGDDGLSAYEIWKKAVADGTIEWPKTETEVTDFFKYLKGKDGKDGKDGQSAYEQWKDAVEKGTVDNPHKPGTKWPAGDNSVQDFWRFLTGATGENGQTPHIGDNGNWWIGDTDTGIAARGKDGVDGKDGKDAVPPTITIGDNGNWFVDGTDTGKPSRGADGKTPTVTIGDNGNWFVDGTDTGKPARGADGKSPEVIIGQNGNWWIDGKDTGKPAYGKDGKDGKSAYELWKEEVETKCGTADAVMDPHNPDIPWDCSKTTLADFWKYLRGKDGKDGQDGETVELGKFNVLPEYYDVEKKEYVYPSDGKVVFSVYDKVGNKAPAGSKVKGLPGMDPNAEFTTDSVGQFSVPWNQLPDQKPLEERKGATQSVTIGGVTEVSAENTFVPNRVNVRCSVTECFLGTIGSFYYENGYNMVELKLEYQVDGTWRRSDYINTATDEGLSNINESLILTRIKDVNQPVSPQNIDTSQDYNHRDWWGNYKHQIARPHTLTPNEKQWAAENPSSALARREWDNTDYYFSYVFGDGEGTISDYGQTIYLEDKIHVPEIDPVCGFKNPKLEIKQGVTTLWGEFEVSELNHFCKIGRENSFVKDDATKIWELKDPVRYKASGIDPNSYFYIYMSLSASGTGGDLYTDSKNFTNPHFALVGAYPGGTICVSHKDGGHFRGRDAYRLRETSGKYYLEDYYTGEKVMDVPVENMPADWMK